MDDFLGITIFGNTHIWYAPTPSTSLPCEESWMVTSLGASVLWWDELHSWWWDENCWWNPFCVIPNKWNLSPNKISTKQMEHHDEFEGFPGFFRQRQGGGGVSQKWFLKYQLLIDNIYIRSREMQVTKDKDPNPIPIKDVWWYFGSPPLLNRILLDFLG